MPVTELPKYSAQENYGRKSNHTDAAKMSAEDGWNDFRDVLLTA
jgi:hypothetical protein